MNFKTSSFQLSFKIHHWGNLCGIYDHSSSLLPPMVRVKKGIINPDQSFHMGVSKGNLIEKGKGKKSESNICVKVKKRYFKNSWLFKCCHVWKGLYCVIKSYNSYIFHQITAHFDTIYVTCTYFCNSHLVSLSSVSLFIVVFIESGGVLHPWNLDYQPQHKRFTGNQCMHELLDSEFHTTGCTPLTS